MTLAQQLFDIFYAGCTHYSIAKVNSYGGLAYYTEEGVPSLDLIQMHLDGTTVLGAYTLLPGNTVRWMAFDVDSKADPAKAREIARKLCDFLGGISYIVEWSGNKGYHILIFFATAVPATEAKKIGETIREHLGFAKNGDPHVEVFPKQDRLTETSPLGNLLRLPLGQHPTTHNWTCFVDPYNGWEEGPHKDPETLLGWRVGLGKMKEFIQTKEPDEQVKTILLPYWTGGQRHDLALWMAGYLSSVGWTEDAVVQLVTELTDEVGEGDLPNLTEAVHDTFAKVYNNQNVRGFDGLATLLPSSVLQKLTAAATNQTFGAALQVLDRIRLGKGAGFQKVRIASLTILSYLKEQGKLVQDRGVIYWLDRETRDLLVLGNDDWIRFIHNTFGINPVDSFGKQVMESVRLYALDEAQRIGVYRRAFWRGEELILNLGGREVYILNGNVEERRLVLNGDENILFINSEDRLNIPNLMTSEVTAISPWSVLVDDVSFATTESVKATPDQQKELLKAWILSVFFAQAMPTRPILTILAPAGAGKTTTARRILRFFEGLDEDVLGVVQDKPDSIRASLMEHKILVLDNLEKSRALWLPDILNRVSTGSHIEIRTLYKTNTVLKLIPDCYVIITATEIPFSEETVYTRILPLELAALNHPRPEHQIQIQMIDQLEGMWKGMLQDLDEVVYQLKNNRSVEAPNESRLADFTVFCARIKDAYFMDGEELMTGLGNMLTRQRQVLQQSSPFIQVLENWIRAKPEEAGAWRTMSDFYPLVQKYAVSNRMEWRWTSAQGLSRHIAMLEPQLIRYFGLSTRNVRQNGGEVKQYKFVKDMIDAADPGVHQNGVEP